MISVGGTVRFLYNHFLKVNIDQYQANKTFVWHFDMCKQLVALKKQHTWLKETYSQVLQSSLKDLDQALKNMKHGAGFPKFKSKYTTPISFRYQQHTSISACGKYVNLPKLGAIKLKLHRDLPSEYIGCNVTKSPSGTWYISFIVERAELLQVDKIHNPVGVDVNSEFTALSTDVLIANPRPLSKKHKQIKNLQRKLSRKIKSSKNRLKAKNKLARAHDQVRCQRYDHIHQLSARIAKAHDLVSVETLKIDEMKRKSTPTAKAVADAGWGMLASLLEYKCQLLGHHFIKINQWLPSSKTCSSCGHKKNSLDLKQREYHCDACGSTLHRDINAAINIKNWGHQQWCNDHTGQELPKAPVDAIMDILANYGDCSASQTKQEAVGL